MNNFDKIVSLCKRRGFVFPSSEIYGGFAAVYDYGHYGVLLKNNIQAAWWKQMVQERDDVYGLDSAIFMHPKTWVASGHVGSFNDPQVDCKKCKARFRADYLLEEFGVSADKATLEFINSELDKLRKQGKLKCPVCGSIDLTPAKFFSLMVKSNLGLPTEELTEENAVYLRPETCGGIYLEYKNTLDALHPKLPFGIAQVGKAFRNEIVARQFIFRTREFEQMEMQYFLNPKDMKAKLEEWKKERWRWYLEYGISENRIRWQKHEKLAHYASDAYDIEFDFQSFGGLRRAEGGLRPAEGGLRRAEGGLRPAEGGLRRAEGGLRPAEGGFKEVEGIHARGDWDLSQHSKHSGVDLSYLDEELKEKFIPHIMETSAGLNRLFLMFIDSAYVEEEINGETRTVLKLDKRLAPIKVAVFPLLKNKPELVKKAREIFETLKKDFMCEFDDNGNIGKRYRRQDEIGTAYCVTIDFDTLKDNTVTIRDRDTTKQTRVKTAKIQKIINS